MRVPAILAVLLGAFVLSCSGLIVRNIEHATAWQIVCYRALSLVPAICLVYVLRHRGRVMSELSRAGWRPLLLSVFPGFGSVSFVLALTQTTVASTMLILSAVPLFAAGLGWIFLRERVRLATLAGIGASGLGIALVMMDGFRTGTIVGNLLALANSLSFASYVVLLRRHNDADMLPSAAFGAIIAATVAAIAAPDLDVPASDIMLCVLWGGVIQCLGMWVTVFASKHLPAAELCLLMLLEFVLGPTWVWLFLGEIPGLYAVGGGAIVVLSVALWLIGERRRLRQAR